MLSQLKQCDVGIICLTKENLESQWIHFEGGAIAKQIDTARLCPWLIDVTSANVAGPLTAFQMKQLDREGILAIVEMINSSSDKPLTHSDLIESFEIRWLSIEAKIAEIKSIPESTKLPAERPDREILEEILMRVRATGTQIFEPKITFTNFIGQAVKDEKAQQMAAYVKEEVSKRRPLIVTWLEGADCYRHGESTLIFVLPKAESIALESLSRGYNKKLLDDLGKELGFEIRLASVG